jgi:hypothetical protein
MCQTDVEFEQIDMKISKKNVQILERYGQGALARRETSKMKSACIKQITGKYSKLSFISNRACMYLDLPFPCYKDDDSEQIQYLDKKLFEDDEI